MSPRFLTVLFVLLGTLLTAQCDIDVDAGPDRTVCPDEFSILLEGSVTADQTLLGVTWDPATFLSVPDELVTTYFGGESATFTLRAAAIDETDNLFVNADFEAGQDGSFTTEYTEPTVPGAFGLLSAEGTYTLASNSGDTHDNFANCDDHTGGGQMMVVNGATTANENVYCQTVSINPGTRYAVRAFVQSVVGSNPARLQFSVNGSLLGGAFSAGGTVCDWASFDARWDSGTATTAEVCIVNRNTEEGGNDFALDDLYFGPVCESEDEVTITIPELEIDLSESDFLACDAPASGQAIDIGATSTGPGYTYGWTTDDGNIVSGGTTPEPRVDQPGTYTLLLTYDDGSVTCSAEEAIEILQDPRQPEAIVTQESPVPCGEGTVTLSGALSTIVSNTQFFWSTTDGNITSGTRGVNIEVDRGGTYTLAVVNGPCQAEASFTVPAFGEPPAVSVGAFEPLSCNRTSVTLDATASPSGAGLTGSWTTTDGNILTTTDDGYTVTVDRVGEYVFTLTDTDRDCASRQTFTVAAGDMEVAAVVTTPENLPCSGGSVVLDGTGSEAGPGVLYTWSTTDGEIAGRTDRIQVTIVAAGSYVLTVTNADGCSNSVSVTVARDGFAPQLLLSRPEPIPCAAAQIELQADVTGEDGVTYRWTSTDGTVLEGTTTPMLAVASDGTYVLTVTSANGECSVTDSLVVTGFPREVDLVVATDAELITCTEPTADLSVETVVPELRYSWLGPDGGAGPNVTVMAPGQYVLNAFDPASGCTTTSDTLTIREDRRVPTIDIAPVPPLDCANAERRIEATVGTDPEVTLSWSGDGTILDGADTSTPTVGSAGTYVLLATNVENGCASIAMVTVTDNAANRPLAEAGPPVQITCLDPAPRLNSTGSSTGESVALEWSGPEGGLLDAADNPAPRVSAAGVYRLTIRDSANDCSATDTVVVTGEAILPVASIIGGGELTCRSDSVLLRQDDMGENAGVEYRWTAVNGPPSDTVDGPLLTVRTPGTYELIATLPGAGCRRTDSLTVVDNRTRPDIQRLPEATLTCEDAEVTVTAVDRNPGRTADISWVTIDGNIISGTTGPTITANQPGPYEVTFTYPETGCSSTARWVVTSERDLPRVNILAPDTDACTSDSLRLALELDRLGYTVSWEAESGEVISGGTTPAPVVTSPGNYVVTILDPSSGCRATDRVDLAGGGVDGFTVAVVPGNCDRETATLRLRGVNGGSGPFLLSTDGGVTFFPEGEDRSLEPGPYRLVVQDAEGCTAEDSVLVAEPDVLELAVPDATTIRTGDSLLLFVRTDYSVAPIDTIRWSPVSTLSCADCLFPVARPLQSTTYTVLVRTDDGCTAEARVAVTVDNNESIYFPSAFSPNEDGTNDRFHPFGEADRILGIRSFRIYDRWGNQVHEVAELRPNDPLPGWDGRFRGQDLNPGVYVYSAVVTFVGIGEVVVEGEVTLMR